MTSLFETFGVPDPVALVTGSGAPRVGRAIARHLASLGCRLALHANTSVDQAQQVADELRQQHALDVIVTQGALDDDGVAESLVDQTGDHFGRLDILVNSAAIWRPTPLADVTAAEMRRYFEINTIASFLCARAAGMIMAKQDRGGSIINIGDWATGRPYLDHAAYFPSKGAVEVMTRSLAVELSQLNRGIRVNCIQPGPVLLDDSVSDNKRGKIAESTLVGRVGTPQNVAHAVQFLCENDFVNGVCLPVDGGRGIYAPDGMQVGMNTG
ncbi:Glucose 1-dehydrogenase B [Rubripirellula lacrimiformis]|uniref:Glucose 1-dehydrogenase B n=1 Tax=Rubripirellula lacrimiformis TaxID=1930273 RepID=A0A517NIN3_9BACT|nr:SDR family oxidoreductase [Rubripirellula lacrimiformis]QDT06996.1 Glucose 1-dehydrogenase B [Rubripirellula lacrimiformis]